VSLESNYPRLETEEVRRRLYLPMLFCIELCLTVVLALVPVFSAFMDWVNAGVDPVREVGNVEGVSATSSFDPLNLISLMVLLCLILHSGVVIMKRSAKDLRQNFLFWPWVCLVLGQIVAFCFAFSVGAALIVLFSRDFS